MIECTKLGASFAGRNLFKDLDIVINAGERVAIMGPSGCGKSTLLRMLVGLQVKALSETGKVLRHGTTSYLPQDSKDCVLPWKSVGQTLSDELMSDLRITECRSQFPRELSGGQLRRLALGQIISLNRQIVVLDEPLTGLDKDLRDAAIHFIKRRLVSSSILVFVTHYQEEADNLASKCVSYNERESRFICVQ